MVTYISYARCNALVPATLSPITLLASSLFSTVATQFRHECEDLLSSLDPISFLDLLSLHSLLPAAKQLHLHEVMSPVFSFSACQGSVFSADGITSLGPGQRVSTSLSDCV